MARLQLHARATASGSNADILALADAVTQAKTAFEAAGGEWRGAGLDITLDHIEDAEPEPVDAPVVDAAPTEEAPE